MVANTPEGISKGFADVFTTPIGEAHGHGTQLDAIMRAAAAAQAAGGGATELPPVCTPGGRVPYD